MSTDRRNFILHVLNGVLFFISEAFTDPNLVVTAFLSQLTPSNVLIGLLAPLRDTGWFLPQLFISPWVERKPVKVRVYATVTYFRSAGWILLVLSMFLIEPGNLLLIAFFGCMLLIALSAGFAGLPYMTVTQKVIPKDRLGLLFGLRLSIGGSLSVLASGLVGVILAGQVFGLSLRFPDNYALLFAIATMFFIAGCVIFTFIKEKPDDVPAKATPLKTQFNRAGTVLKGDPRFLKFLSMRIALMFALTCIPFVTVYAKRELQVSDATIGALVPVALIAGLLSNLVWARINDRRSSRTVLALCSLLGLVLCSIALALVQWGSRAIVLLPAAYALGGIITSGIGVSTTPQMIEIVPAGQGPLYFGLLNTLLGVAMLFTSLVGVIVDQFGYAALFLFCGTCFALALERILRLKPNSTTNAAAA
jgi:MFS family permease